MASAFEASGVAEAANRHFVLVGGAGFIGSAVSIALRCAGFGVTVVDRQPPPQRVTDLGATWINCDVLVQDPYLPDGEVVVMLGNGNPRPRWLWTLALDIGIATARLLPALRNRRVTLISSVEIYGTAKPPLVEDQEPGLPWSVSSIQDWCDQACDLARWPCPPWRVAAVCRTLSEADPSGRWVYGIAKFAQEVLVRRSVADPDYTVLRLANTFGEGQERVVARLVRRAIANQPIEVTLDAIRSFIRVDDVAQVLMASPGPGIFNLGGPPISIGELAEIIIRLCDSSSRLIALDAPASDSCGLVDVARLHQYGIHLPSLESSLAEFVDRMRRWHGPLFSRPIPIVVPPRPVRPDELVDRQQNAQWSGMLKNGNRWSSELHDRLRSKLALERGDELLITTSGTEALRLAIVAAVGSAQPGQVAVLPSFTYPATADVLVQLGYTLRFVDVDAATWTLDPRSVERALNDGMARIVVGVDTFGNPCDYDGLRAVCTRARVALVADSAAGIGSLYQGTPLGRQADAHAFSMSFAKVLSAGGAGGATVIRGDSPHLGLANWLDSSLMDELHAAAALDQLDSLDDLVERRIRIAALYGRCIQQFDQLSMQAVVPGNRHSYVHWVARVPHRADVSRRLTALGVQTRAYFSSLHLKLNDRNPAELPVSDALDREVLALPMSSELTIEDADSVALALELALADDWPGDSDAHNGFWPLARRRPETPLTR